MPEDTLALLRAIHEVQTHYIEEADSGEAFENLLARLLELTRSEYGFLGEILQADSGQPYLKTHAITDIAWDEETRRFYDENAPEGLEFTNLETLFGEAIKTGEPVISNDPANDPRAGGLPPGHPPLLSFLALPILLQDRMTGVVGIANRPDGYDEELIRFLEPFTTTCATLLQAYGNVKAHKKAQEESSALNQQMLETQKLESVGMLAGGIAHEFNNLLVGILGNASLLRDRHPVSPEQREMLSEILEAGQRASDLCSQMLAYAGKGKFQIARVHLSEVVRESAHLIESSISRSIAVRYRLVSALPEVEADVHQMRQMLLNLVLNGVEAIEGGKGTVTISTGLAHYDPEDLRGLAYGENLLDRDVVYLEVHDTGCGIEAGVRDRIFEPFFSTKFLGRGLGLAAVQGIVRSHEGALALSSEEGQGSTFRVLLPAVDGVEAAVVARRPAAPPPSAAEPTIRSFPGKILVIDDEEGVRAFVARILEDIGTEFLTATDGEEGLRLFQVHREEIAAVLLDLEMPKSDGIETLGGLLQVDPGVRVVMMSGYSEEDVTYRFGDQPLRHFIQKPYSATDLLEILFQVIDA